jgi:hypothetical protein
MHAPQVSRMTTFGEVHTKSKSGPCSRDDKFWLLVIAQPDRHPGLPHSPSTKQPQSREVQFDKIITKLLSLRGLIQPDMCPVQIKTCPSGPK